MKKRIFALLLALCMVFGMTNVAMAEETVAVDLGYMGTAMEVTIPAGDSVLYSQYRVAGMELKVTGDNAYIIHGGEQFDAVEGVATALMQGMSPMFPCEFEIGNAGTAEATFTVEFVVPVGSMDNPEVVEEDGSYTAVIAEGDSDGYWYTYEAPADGTLGVSISAYDVDWNEVGWTYQVNNLTTGVYGDQRWSDDDPVVNPTELEVSEGDVIKVMVSSYDPDAYVAPAANVYTYIYFTYPLGTENNPIGFEELESEITIPVGTTHYVAPFSGSLMTITAEGEYTVVVGEDEYTPENGAVTVQIPEGSGWGPSATYFSIVNAEETEIEAAVEFVYPEGNMNNPDEIEDGKYDIAFKEGAKEYYFNWTAKADGIVTVGVTSEGGWQYTVNNMTTYAYGDSHWSDDEVVVPSEVLEVSKGDVLEIRVITYDPEDMWNAPAGTVTTTVSFTTGVLMDEEAVGDVVADIEDAKTEDETAGEVVLEWYDEETGDATTTVLPEEVLEAAKDNNVVLEVLMGLYGWVIDPTTIADDATSVSLEVLLDTENIETTLIDKIAEKNDYAQFSLVHDGPFDFTANLILPISAEYAGKNAVLYWNNNGTLVKMGECVVAAEEDAEIGTVVFEFEHASDYVVVVEGTAPVPDTGDNTNFALWFAVLALGVVAIAGSVVMKKREF